MENTTPPKTWFLESILVTIFCCLPLGIVSIIKANKVKTLTKAGLTEDANFASADAKKWIIYTAIAGVIFLACYYIFVFMYMKNSGALENLGQ